MSEAEKLPIEQVLPGVSLHPLPDGDTPLEVFALIKVLDRKGEPGWSFRGTPGLNDEELLGALTVQVARLTRHLGSTWDADED